MIALYLLMVSIAGQRIRDLDIAVMLPMTGSTMPIGPAFVPAMEYALETIHARDDILPDYRIDMRILDTKVGCSYIVVNY